MPRRQNASHLIKILRILQTNNQTPNQEIASLLGISKSQVSKLIAQLRHESYIVGDRAIINSPKLGLNTLAYIKIALIDASRIRNTETISYIETFPNIQEIHHIQGEFDLMVKVRGAGNAVIMKFIDFVHEEGNVKDTMTIMILETIRETLEIDIKDDGPSEARISAPFA
jgi:DNA-binding Lrp family transcriptional regulator